MKFLAQMSLILISVALMSGCSSKGSLKHSQYGTGETQNGGVGYGTLRRVHFNFDQANLDQESLETLKYNISRMENNQKMKVLIEGHTDERGSTEYNIALGERRAAAVVNYLSNSGVQRSRLQQKSWGEERPLAPGKSAADYGYNRRAEFILLAK